MNSLYILVIIGIFLITINPVQLLVDGTSGSTGCSYRHVPPGYTHLPEHGYYKFHPQKVTWLLAYMTCQWENGHLIVLNSDTEAKFVTTLWNSGGWAWIGTHDLYDEGVYITIYNETLQQAGYNNVQPGEHNGGVDENCGAMKKDSQLVNHWCHEKLAFICEIEL